MKKYFLLLFGLLLVPQILFAQVPSYVPSNGLVGYWSFDGNANDESGNNNNGTVNGATPTTDRFGNSNSAYSFDGVNDYIRCINPGPSGSTSRSVCFWMKTAEIGSGNGNIFNYGNNDVYGQDFRIVTSVNGPNCQGIGVGFTGTGKVLSTTYSNNLWKFYCVVFDSSNGNNISSLNVWENGVLISNICYQDPPNNNANTGTLNPVTIGRYHWLQINGGNCGNCFFTGVLDDMGMWNRALSEQEITAMYNGVNYSDTCNAVSGSLTNGLVGYWPFCGNANDDSGNGNNGTVNGATLTTDRFGNSNSAYNFDGNNNHILVSDNSTLSGFSDITISLWVNISQFPSASDPFSGLVTKWYGSGNCGAMTDNYACYLRTNNQFVGGTNQYRNYPNMLQSPSNLSTSNWYHLVVVHNSTTGGSIYINGSLVSTYNTPGALCSSTNPLYFGCDNGLGAINRFFNGKLDDIGIWNRALTQQEVTQLYSQNQCITNITVTDTLIINVGQLSYTNPVSFANNITIYPNPANTQVNISFNNITDLTGGNINIINSLGQQVATTPITLSGTNTIMPLNTWGGTGLYFVQILNAQGIVVDVKKIILQ